MSTRRGHRKSRHGCAECKKRHIKCDESRPLCANCSITNRGCSFASSIASIPARLNPSTSVSSTGSPPPSLANSQNSPSAWSNSVSPQCLPEQVAVPLPNILDVPPANLTQLELLHHFTNGSFDFNFVPIRSSMVTPSKVLDKALSCDYLMNEILAFSARHLAIQRVDRREFYLHQAKQLQTHALMSFTREKVQPTKDNCLAVLFFAWLLGTHMLCDVAALDDQHDFLDEFLNYFQLYRGVRAVTASAWVFLLETEHRDMFQDGRARVNNVGTGNHTSPLRLLIRDSLGMDDTQKKGNDEALARLQWVFDLYEENGLEDALNDCFRIVFSWPLILSPEFVGLLQKRRPEALLTLSYFAVLLHWCGRHWIFGRVGSRLLQSIISALGQGWERWLQWPKDMIEKSS